MAAVALACVALMACENAGQPADDVARDLGNQLSAELRAYRDTGLEARLETARITCVQIATEATEGRLYGTDYGRALASACDVVGVLGTDPGVHVETAISLVDLALQMLR